MPLKLHYLNARSYCRQNTGPEIFVNNYFPHVICITETWFLNDISNSVFCLNNYQIFRKYGDDSLNAHCCVLIAVTTENNPVLLDNNSIHEVVFENLRIKKQDL